MRPLKVLIVDDQLLLLLDYESRVEDLGHQAITATNGNQAAALYSDHGDIDAVISDIRMPHGDGIFLLQYIKRSSRPKPPVLMHSSEKSYVVPGVTRDIDLSKLIPQDFPFARFHLKLLDSGNYINDFLEEIAKESVS